jgi:hypothetical protein
MKRLLLALLFPLALAAQTVVNPSFEVNPSVPNFSQGTGGPWGTAAPSGWTMTGNGGLWQPDTTVCGYNSLPNGATVAWSDGATFSQDVGQAQANQVYTLTVFVGHRGCQPTANFTISLYSGTTLLCQTVGTNANIPQNTFVSENCSATITAAPMADLVIQLSASGSEVDFDEVSLVAVATGPPPPFLFQLQGGPLVNFPMYIPPACGPNDGTCSIQIQVVMPANLCSTDPTGQTMTCTGTSGQINLLKNITLPVPQTQTIPVAVTQ